MYIYAYAHAHIYLTMLLHSSQLHDLLSLLLFTFISPAQRIRVRIRVCVVTGQDSASCGQRCRLGPRVRHVHTLTPGHVTLCLWRVSGGNGASATARSGGQGR